MHNYVHLVQLCFEVEKPWVSLSTEPATINPHNNPFFFFLYSYKKEGVFETRMSWKQHEVLTNWAIRLLTTTIANLTQVHYNSWFTKTPPLWNFFLLLSSAHQSCLCKYVTITSVSEVHYSHQKQQSKATNSIYY